MRELIVDNFAGGGGASTGIELATGRSVDIAINHDPHAIAMHTTNHPGTLHYCENVFDLDPLAATAHQPVALAWFSPDCRHFSRAKGATPVAKEIRGLAWVVIRWALAVRPRVMMLENVAEFQTWGPLLDDIARPDPVRAGETFAAFVGMLGNGIPADHPALDEVCDFLNIDRHGIEARRLIAGLGYAIEHRELRACDYGAPTIRKRFFMVMRCDGKPIAWPQPTHGDPKSLAVQSGHIKHWRTAAGCIDWSLPCNSIFGRKKPLAENTLKRIARGIQRFVIDNPAPFIVKCNHTSTRTKYDCFRGHALSQPMQTITQTHGYAVVAPIFAGTGGSTFQMKPRPVNKPFITLMSQNRTNVVAPVLAPVISRQFGNSTGHAIDEPAGTVTAGGGGKSALVTAFLAKHFGGNYSGPGAPLDSPAHTVTATDHHALITSSLIKMRGTNIGQQTDLPLQTVTAGGNHFGEVRAFLEKYCGDMGKYPGLVNVDGVNYHIVDIGMRMLQPQELYAAQGFPADYIIDSDHHGVKYSKDKQVARCGNAVPPQFAEALVRANLPEMCAGEVAA